MTTSPPVSLNEAFATMKNWDVPASVRFVETPPREFLTERDEWLADKREECGMDEICARDTARDDAEDIDETDGTEEGE